MVAQDLVVTWEDTYRRYVNAAGNDVTQTSRAVAGAWRELAARAELPWWLSAAVRSAAQAFEHQAEAWAADGVVQYDMANTQEDGEEESGDEEEHGAYHAVVLPSQQEARKPCACTHAPPITGTLTNAGAAMRALA